MDASQVALATERSARLHGPVRIIFEWRLSEPDLRASGRGVARLEPPYRARLDLFTENGETLVRAALVGDELRLPPGSRSELIPPPALFWGTLGVFRPGTGSGLLGGERVEDAVELRYRLPVGSVLHIRVEEGRLREAALLEGGHVTERVTLGKDLPSGFPGTANYRHLADFRELVLTLESVEHVEPYPSEIWDPRD